MRSFLYYISRSSLLYGTLGLTLVLILAGCKQRPLPEADSPPALIYAAKCGTCHPLRHPMVHTYTGWKKTILIMEKRAEELGMSPLLSDEEKTAILGYLKKNARKGI